MSKTAKAPILLIVFILLFVLAVVAGGALYLNLQKESARSASLQDELNAAKESSKLLESKIDEARKTIQGLELKLKNNSTQIDMLNKELQNEKSLKEEALSQVDSLMQDLTQQKSLRADLEEKLTQTQAQAKKMQEQMNALEGKKAELEVKIKELEEKSQGVELGTIVVTPEVPSVPDLKAAAKPAPAKKAAKVKEKKVEPAPAVVSGGTEGKVLVVNKDYNFAVVSLGNRDGISTGDEFAIYHGNKYIGDAKVEKVHDSMTAAGFTSEDMKNRVSEGDRAVLKSK